MKCDGNVLVDGGWWPSLVCVLKFYIRLWFLFAVHQQAGVGTNLMYLLSLFILEYQKYWFWYHIDTGVMVTIILIMVKRHHLIYMQAITIKASHTDELDDKCIRTAEKKFI